MIRLPDIIMALLDGEVGDGTTRCSHITYSAVLNNTMLVTTRYIYVSNSFTKEFAALSNKA
jgi:hypothetical protein